ncbi:carboxypeptidase-like regulatory domain-containing protein [Bacteroidota bacterium]
MKTINIYLILLLTSLSSYTQKSVTCMLRGRIVDKITAEPVIAAHVILMESTFQTGSTTNEYGYFKIKNLPVGRYDLYVRHIGYESYRMDNIYLTSGKETILYIEVEEKIIKMPEVSVSYNDDKIIANNEMATVSARQFTIEETNKFAGSFGDISRMVVNYAGVQAISNQRNDIIIRGNNPMGLLWRLEGVDIPNPNHFGQLGSSGGAVTILNNNVLMNSDFFTGAFPANYGNALAGVFDLRMRPGNAFKHETTAQFGYNGIELGFEGPISHRFNSSYIVNYRYSTLGLVSKLGFNINVVPDYQDLSFKFNFPNTIIGSLALFGIGGKSSIDVLESDKDTSEWLSNITGKDVYTGSDMGVVGIKHNVRILEVHRVKTLFAVTGERNFTEYYSVNVNDRTIDFSGKRELSELKYFASSNLISKLNLKNILTNGVSVENFYSNYLDTIKTINQLDFSYNINSENIYWFAQAYSQLKHKFNNRLSATFGLHFQDFIYNNSISLEPRFGIKFFIDRDKKSSVNFGYGMHSQLQPRFIYEINSQNNGANVKSNTKLDFSRANHYIFGTEQLITNYFRVKAEIYYQSLYNIPVKESKEYYSILNEGADYSINYEDSLRNEGTGKNYGVELTLEQFLYNGYYYLVTASFYESKYEGYDKIERNTAFNGNFVINTLGGYEYEVGQNNLLTIDARILWAGGKRYISINKPASQIAFEPVYDISSAYEKRRKDYFMLNLRIGFKLNKPKFSLLWSMDFQNITNYKNIFIEKYDPLRGDVITEYQLGFIPVGRIKFEF